MPEATIVAPDSAEPTGSTGRDVPSSYCCECGTYDAHASVCTCCGFDFTGGASDDEDA